MTLGNREPPKLAYTTSELAAAWGVSRQYVDKLRRAGELKAFRLANGYRYEVDEVKAYMKRQSTDRPRHPRKIKKRITRTRKEAL